MPTNHSINLTSSSLINLQSQNLFPCQYCLFLCCLCGYIVAINTVCELSMRNNASCPTLNIVDNFLFAIIVTDRLLQSAVGASLSRLNYHIDLGL